MEVLGIALAQGNNINAQGIVLAQIKKEIEVLNKSVLLAINLVTGNGMDFLFFIFRIITKFVQIEQ